MLAVVHILLALNASDLIMFAIVVILLEKCTE